MTPWYRVRKSMTTGAMDESCHIHVICGWVLSHTHTQDNMLTYLCMFVYTHLCVCEWVMPHSCHVWMRSFVFSYWRQYDHSYICMCIYIHMYVNQSCHIHVICEWVMSHTHTKGNKISYIYMYVCIHICVREWVISYSYHKWMSHFTFAYSR